MPKAKQALRGKDPDSSCVAIQPELGQFPQDDGLPEQQHDHQHPTGTGRIPQHEEHSLSQVEISHEMATLRNSVHPAPLLVEQRNQDLLSPFRGGMHVNEQEQIDRLLRHDTGVSITASTSVHSTPHPSPNDAVLLNELARIEQRNQEMIDGVHSSVLPDIER